MDLDLVDALASLAPALVGRRLREARIAAGLTQPQVGGTAASVGYLSRIERGERRVGPELLEALCRNIGVSTSLIIRGSAPTDPRTWECALDFADLELITGDTKTAKRRANELLGQEDLAQHPSFTERARLIRAKANAATGHTAEAIDDFNDVYRTRATRTGWLEAAAAMTRLLRETGDLTAAIRTGETTLTELGTNIADREATSRISMNLAAALYEAGDTTRALTICRQAIRESETAGTPTTRAAAYWNTAIIACEAGELDEALTLTRRALALLADIEDTRLLARLRTQLGIFLLRADPPQTDEALTQLLDAQAAYQVSDADLADLLHNRMAIARAHFATGDLDRANTEAAAVLDEANEFPFVAATASTLLARIAQANDNAKAARTHILAAVHSLSAVGADRQAAQQWFTLATLLDDMGLSDEAKDAFKRAAVSTGLTQSYGTPQSNARLDA